MADLKTQISKLEEKAYLLKEQVITYLTKFIYIEKILRSFEKV